MSKVELYNAWVLIDDNSDEVLSKKGKWIPLSKTSNRSSNSLISYLNGGRCFLFPTKESAKMAAKIATHYDTGAKLIAVGVRISNR